MFASGYAYKVRHSAKFDDIILHKQNVSMQKHSGDLLYLETLENQCGPRTHPPVPPPAAIPNNMRRCGKVFCEQKARKKLKSQD